MYPHKPELVILWLVSICQNPGRYCFSNDACFSLFQHLTSSTLFKGLSQIVAEVQKTKFIRLDPDPLPLNWFKKCELLISDVHSHWIIGINQSNWILNRLLQHRQLTIVYICSVNRKREAKRGWILGLLDFGFINTLVYNRKIVFIKVSAKVKFTEPIGLNAPSLPKRMNFVFWTYATIWDRP